MGRADFFRDGVAAPNDYRSRLWPHPSTAGCVSPAVSLSNGRTGMRIARSLTRLFNPRRSRANILREGSANHGASRPSSGRIARSHCAENPLPGNRGQCLRRFPREPGDDCCFGKKGVDRPNQFDVVDRLAVEIDVTLIAEIFLALVNRTVWIAITKENREIRRPLLTHQREKSQSDRPTVRPQAAL